MALLEVSKGRDYSERGIETTTPGCARVARRSLLSPWCANVASATPTLQPGEPTEVPEVPEATVAAVVAATVVAAVAMAVAMAVDQAVPRHPHRPPGKRGPRAPR